jgi:cation diffusion facilitator CzcD-associated flavoprotein CzcO
MPSETVRCAIVGSGLAALAAYATLRHAGVRPEEIVVYGTHEDPTEVWRTRAAAIRQQRMRSESDGHVGAAAFPGLAMREAVRRLTVTPLVATLASRYHPRVEDFLRHAEGVRARSGWDQSFRCERIDRIAPVEGGFALDGGTFRHVLVATGHPGLQRPPEYPEAVHAYEPHEYAAKVAVVGAGMAAATEWLNALAAGSEVVSIRRREPLRRALNVPRAFFSKRGLAAFHAASAERRASTLRELSTPSYPTGPAWDEPIAAAERLSQFRVSDSSQTQRGVEQVICATGFRRGWREDTLLRDLVERNDLPTHGRWIALSSDSTVPGLTDPRRTLSIAGVAGQWAFPAADTIAGAKYAAHGFVRHVCRTR